MKRQYELHFTNGQGRVMVTRRRSVAGVAGSRESVTREPLRFTLKRHARSAQIGGMFATRIVRVR
jgi:hypothetical protein